MFRKIILNMTFSEVDFVSFLFLQFIVKENEKKAYEVDFAESSIQIFHHLEIIHKNLSCFEACKQGVLMCAMMHVVL